MKISIEKIAKILDGKVIGESSIIIEKINTIEDAKNGEISFIANPKYEKHLFNTKASCVLISNNFQLNDKIKTNLNSI